eukprot:gene32453-40053_t
MIHPATYVNKVLVAYSNGELELWNINKKAIVYTFSSHLKYIAQRLAQAAEDDEDDKPVIKTSAVSITCMEQSPACDVIALGYSNGEIVLINLKLDQVLFTFTQEGGAVTSLSFRTDVSAERFPFMASSSADGRVFVWNLGSGPQEKDGEADEDGDSAIQRRLHSTLEDAHEGPVSRVSFMHGEPIMVSTGASDNSIKVWIFDSPDGSARLLRSREGHSGGPTRIRYYGGTTNVSMRDNADGMSCELISAGSDGSVRLFNTAIESQNREMSQKPILKQLGMQRRNERLPHCTGFDFSETRARDWGNMATIHRNHSNVYVWKYKHRVVTDMILRQASWATNERKVASSRHNHATSVTLSPCGNFCLVGYKGGMIYKYNLQSGATRGAYPKNSISDMKQGLIDIRARIPGNVLFEEKRMSEDAMLSVPGQAPTPSAKGAAPGASLNTSLQGLHTQDVTGLFMDMTNTTLVSCGRDGKIVFWDFHNHTVWQELQMDSPQLMMQGFRDGNFVAIAGQDRVIRVFDMLTFKLSRRFAGHSQEITDMAFTPDGRRLLSSSGDSTVRVWDMPTGRCLSWMKFATPVLTMAVSLSGEFLCVAQADREGIYMYIDKSLYETVHFWKEPTVPTPMADSSILVDQSEPAVETAVTELAEGDLAVVDSVAVSEITPGQAQVVTDASRETGEQRGDGSITLSVVPKAYWKSLFHLEVIKKRNKPKAPPKAAPLAPFFLPTVVRGGSTPSFPTPAEFAAITKTITAEAQAVENLKNGVTVTPAVAAITKRSFFEEDSVAPEEPSSKKGKSSASTTSNAKLTSAEEEAVLNDLATMGSVWEDEEESSSGGASWVVDRTSNTDLSTAMEVTDNEEKEEESKVVVTSKDTKNARSQSKLITKRTALPRCKLMAYLLQEQTVQQSAEPIDSAATSQLLTYMKTLPPPAVDLEIRALCTWEGDEEGVELLRTWLAWLDHQVTSGDSFEILQAYLHRTLTIYGQMVIKLPQLSDEMARLKDSSAVVSERFREVLQKNLCMIKFMAGIPII